MERINVSAVSYLNTKPFLYGLEHHAVNKQVNLSLDIPSQVAAKLLSGEVQLGLVPVAVLPLMPEYHIISDYCIGCEGEVGSVCIYSKVPITEATHLFLDYQSRTSVELAKILLREYWKAQPQFIPAYPGYEEKIDGHTAAVIIGDRNFGMKQEFAYRYDLGQVWQLHTGYPFVFAAWVSNRELPASFIQSFNEAMQYGIQHIPEVVAKYATTYPTDVKKYLTHYISYPLNTAKREALTLFLKKLKGQ